MGHPSHPRRRAAVAAAAALVVAATAACGADGPATDPGLSPDPLLVVAEPSRDRVDGVTLALDAAPRVVAPGDTVHLVLTARNATGRRVQIGIQCGPPMDVAVRTPRGATRSALADAGREFFTCELAPHHFVDPLGTNVQRIAWPAPAEQGEYVAVAGLRRSDGLGNLSAPVRVTVR